MGPHSRLSDSSLYIYSKTLFALRGKTRGYLVGRYFRLDSVPSTERIPFVKHLESVDILGIMFKTPVSVAFVQKRQEMLLNLSSCDQDRVRKRKIDRCDVDQGEAKMWSRRIGRLCLQLEPHFLLLLLP